MAKSKQRGAFTLAGIFRFVLLKGLLEVFKKLVALFPIRSEAGIKKAAEFMLKIHPVRSFSPLAKKKRHPV
jgi:hypothetical protein